MLSAKHIEYYLDNLLEAYRQSMNCIVGAERDALQIGCSGCSYCKALERHRDVLVRTLPDLLLMTSKLVEGEKPSRSFPKTMLNGETIYRGFITDTGEYIDMFEMGHDDYRKKYAERFGEERAYRMVTIHAPLLRTQVQFVDRKSPPNEKQLTTLRELMIDAEGSLTFNFSYDSRHPTL